MSADATIQRAIAELEAERHDIEKKIAPLRSVLTPAARRRTPDTDSVDGNKRRRRTMSAAARKAVSARMKKYWAERRKTEGK